MTPGPHLNQCSEILDLSFRDLVTIHLSRAVALVADVDPNSIAPQFWCLSIVDDHDWWIAIALDSDHQERLRQFKLLRAFMSWKNAKNFTFKPEAHEPDAVCCVGVSPDETIMAIAGVDRECLYFHPTQWLSIGDGNSLLSDLLPRPEDPNSPADIEDARMYFGRQGKFPAAGVGIDDAEGCHLHS